MKNYIFNSERFITLNESRAISKSGGCVEQFLAKGKIKMLNGDEVDTIRFVSVLSSAFSMFQRNFPYEYKYIRNSPVIYLLDDKFCPTMCISSSGTLFVNVEFVYTDLNMNAEYVMYILYHEALHDILDHIRRGARFNRRVNQNRLSWEQLNWCADYEVNNLMVVDGACPESFFTETMPGLLYDKKYDKWTFEAIAEEGNKITPPNYRLHQPGKKQKPKINGEEYVPTDEEWRKGHKDATDYALDVYEKGGKDRNKAIVELNKLLQKKIGEANANNVKKSGVKSRNLKESVLNESAPKVGGSTNFTDYIDGYIAGLKDAMETLAGPTPTDMPTPPSKIRYVEVDKDEKQLDVDDEYDDNDDDNSSAKGKSGKGQGGDDKDGENGEGDGDNPNEESEGSSEGSGEGKEGNQETESGSGEGGSEEGSEGNDGENNASGKSGKDDSKAPGSMGGDKSGNDTNGGSESGSGESSTKDGGVETPSQKGTGNQDGKGENGNTEENGKPGSKNDANGGQTKDNGGEKNPSGGGGESENSGGTAMDETTREDEDAALNVGEMVKQSEIQRKLRESLKNSGYDDDTISQIMNEVEEQGGENEAEASDIRDEIIRSNPNSNLGKLCRQLKTLDMEFNDIWDEVVKKFLDNRKTGVGDEMMEDPDSTRWGNKNFISQDMVMPYDDEIETSPQLIHIMIDCSGSIDRNICIKFCKFVMQLSNKLKYSGLRLVPFGDNVDYKHILTVRDSDLAKYEDKIISFIGDCNANHYGGGGNKHSFEDTAKFINKTIAKEPNSVFLFLTDGIFDDYNKAVMHKYSAKRSLWILYSPDWELAMHRYGRNYLSWLTHPACNFMDRVFVTI